MLLLNKILRQLTTAFVAFSLVVMAFGTELPAAHAMGLGPFCASFTDVTASEDIRLVQDYAAATAPGDAVVNHFGEDNPSKTADGAAKSLCCSTICSLAFSIAEYNVETLSFGNKDDWQISVKSLTSAESISFKRPPRTDANSFAHA